MGCIEQPYWNGENPNCYQKLLKAEEYMCKGKICKIAFETIANNQRKNICGLLGGIN